MIKLLFDNNGKEDSREVSKPHAINIFKLQATMKRKLFWLPENSKYELVNNELIIKSNKGTSKKTKAQ